MGFSASTPRMARSKPSSAAAMRRSDSVISQRATPLPRHARRVPTVLIHASTRHGAPSPAGRRRTARARRPLRWPGRRRAPRGRAGSRGGPCTTAPTPRRCGARCPSGPAKASTWARRASSSSSALHGTSSRPAGRRDAATRARWWAGRSRGSGAPARSPPRSATASRSTWCSAASVSSFVGRAASSVGAISVPRCTRPLEQLRCRCPGAGGSAARRPTARPCASPAARASPQPHEGHQLVAVPHEPGVGLRDATTPTPTRRRGPSSS